jgi:hypothetical protein
MSHTSAVRPHRFVARVRRGWALFAALLGWMLGSIAALELGQFAAFHAALLAGAQAPGATPKVAALASSLDAASPAGWIGGIVAFVATILCISRGHRWLSPVFGVVAGGAAGAVVGFLAGYSGA